MTRRPKGTGTVRGRGQILHRSGGQPVLEHRAIAERALGHALPKGAEVHHVDENPSNNEPTNLVICPSQSYHKLIHARMRAHAACGDYDARRCTYCRQYHVVVGFVECRRRYQRDRYWFKKKE